MEQNEGVLIRVYQDKERQFIVEIQSLRQKLAAVQQSEIALKQQLQHSDEIRQQLQKSIQMLTEDRNIQQKKCLQIENELKRLKLTTKCEKCAQNNRINGIYENNSFLNNNNLSENEIEKPIPTPRIHKVFILKFLRCFGGKLD